MKYDLFMKLYKEALETEGLDMYICERGWESWMEDYTNGSDPDTVVNVLTAIYQIGKLGYAKIEEILAEVNITNVGAYFGINDRTIRSWSKKERVPQPFCLCFMAYIIITDIVIKKGEM